METIGEELSRLRQTHSRVLRQLSRLNKKYAQQLAQNTVLNVEDKEAVKVDKQLMHGSQYSQPIIISASPMSESKALECRKSIERKIGKVIGVVNSALTWDELNYILVSLQFDFMGRSQEIFDEYQNFKQNTKKTWNSMMDYILHQKFPKHTFIRMELDGKKSIVWNATTKRSKSSTVSSKATLQEYRVTKNDFSYFLERGISHNLIWSIEPLSKSMINHVINLHWPDADIMYWVNPIEFQSVRAIPHVHVLVRAKHLSNISSKL